ncbi:hypothetical protein SAMN06265360_10783 [Haloechinothrix alba]|uniref:Uncharacterized protein n=1 Tax=Haloechinothrix alba TaxID=664784 RepID=A0A238WQP9_9PSEU|nr:hypothetical protein [Haloechinothrix alba]SNR48721.1 hypothetical protein SAMN06265360_10783 [Haloechinothrix alba]
MFSSHGIEVDSWVRIDGSCRITGEVVGDEAQLRLGGVRSSGLDMIADEAGLERLVARCSEVLDTMRSGEP